jgi:hypothetical protein
MATHIEAVIFDGGPLTAALPAGVRTVALAEGLTMLPVVPEVAARLDRGVRGDDRIPAGWMLRQPVVAFARQLSCDRRALYIVCETFGGAGTQEAIAWHEGRLLYGPSGTCDIGAELEPGYHLAAGDDAVNAGLRAIGVQRKNGRDEYATVGLEKHRRTEDWLG